MVINIFTLLTTNVEESILIAKYFKTKVLEKNLKLRGIK